MLPTCFGHTSDHPQGSELQTVYITIFFEPVHDYKTLNFK